MLRHFVRRVPVGASSREAVISQATQADREFWDREIQPFVDRTEPPRADKGWRWATKIQKAEAMARVVGQRPEAYALSLVVDGGRFPVGLVSLCTGFSIAQGLTAVRSPAVFVWYLTAAPPSALEYHLDLKPDQQPGKLTRLTLDIAAVRSLELGQHGCLLLHADPRGGAGLAKWYEQACQMRQVDPKVEWISTLRKNDGRYYYFDQPTALSFLGSNDSFR